jgi:hypothetical protein
MKRISAGVAALFVSFAAPAWAQSATAGIWSASGSAPNVPGACFINGSSDGYGLTLFASPNAPTVFSLDIIGPFAPSTPTVATFSYGAGLSQILTGQFISPTDLRITLDGSTQNNFATFLHGFTAGVTMSMLLGYQAVDFSLAGTSAVVGSMGQCTDAENFNSLPAPWRPASEQPTPTPIFVATPVPVVPAPINIATPTYVATPVPAVPAPINIATPTYVATPVPAVPAPTDIATPTFVAPVSVTPPAPSPALAPAHSWVIESYGEAKCLALPDGGFTSPNDGIAYIRHEGIVPDITINKDDAGNMTGVTLTFTAGNGKGQQMQFYTSMEGCQNQLNQDIQSGSVTDPSQLN